MPMRLHSAKIRDRIYEPLYLVTSRRRNPGNITGRRVVRTAFGADRHKRRPRGSGPDLFNAGFTQCEIENLRPRPDCFQPPLQQKAFAPPLKPTALRTIRDKWVLIL